MRLGSVSPTRNVFVRRQPTLRVGDGVGVLDVQAVVEKDATQVVLLLQRDRIVTGGDLVGRGVEPTTHGQVDLAEPPEGEDLGHRELLLDVDRHALVALELVEGVEREAGGGWGHRAARRADHGGSDTGDLCLAVELAGTTHHPDHVTDRDGVPGVEDEDALRRGGIEVHVVVLLLDVVATELARALEVAGDDAFDRHVLSADPGLGTAALDGVDRGGGVAAHGHGVDPDVDRARRGLCQHRRRWWR